MLVFWHAILTCAGKVSIFVGAQSHVAPAALFV
jgi:hypothetical protein